MNEKFVVEDGDLKELQFTLDENDVWVIGSDPEACEFVIEDPSVDPRHAIIRRSSEGINLENIDSDSPVKVNNEVLAESCFLNDGDAVTIGDVTLHFYADEDSSSLFQESTEEEGDLSIIEESASEKETSVQHDSEKEEASFFHESTDEEIDEQNADPQLELASIDFGLEEAERWLLKVVSGPNNGAEFHMESSKDYVIGTDPDASDIIFQDNSVSRQHARITVSDDDNLAIEDLNSRNGTFVDSKKMTDKQELSPGVVVTVGTTSFVIYDREGEMQTIISPLMPSIVRGMQQEESEKKKGREVGGGIDADRKGSERRDKANKSVGHPQKKTYEWSSLAIIAVIVSFFALTLYGTYNLFKNEPVAQVQEVNPDLVIEQIILSYPSIHVTFNKDSGTLILSGHVQTTTDKRDLMNELRSLKWVKTIDDSGVIIDEYVRKEINFILAHNPAWKDISVQSTKPGQFMIVGFLKTRREAEALFNYMQVNFPNPELLENRVVVEEDLIRSVSNLIGANQLKGVQVELSDAEIILSGTIPADQESALSEVIEKAKAIPGVRDVKNRVKTVAKLDVGVIDLTNRYEVTGFSRINDGKHSVVIDGRILQEGDQLDGMRITSITPNTIFLKKNGSQYRINYKP